MTDGTLFASPESYDWYIMLLRLVLSALAGGCIAAIAKYRSGSQTDATLTLTLVMMCVLIAMATQIIGSNIARAFSLVGALSIVRFRTAVSSTQDVAFVLATVVIGMAIGAGQYPIAASGVMLVMIIAALPFGIARPTSNTQPSSKVLHLTLQSTLGVDTSWLSVLQDLTSYCELASVETVRRGSAIKYDYAIVLNQGLDAVDALQKLNTVPQLESVALKTSA